MKVSFEASFAREMYLFLRQFRLLRERMVPKAQAQGTFTDQDVFDRVSSEWSSVGQSMA